MTSRASRASLPPSAAVAKTRKRTPADIARLPEAGPPEEEPMSPRSSDDDADRPRFSPDTPKTAGAAEKKGRSKAMLRDR